MRNNGFSLIELLIVIAIIGILAGIAYPSYTHYMTKAYRIRAQQNLLLLTKDMAQYYAEHQSYIGVTIDTIAATTIKDDPHYHYQIVKLKSDSYQLNAVPLNMQSKRDSTCGTLSINQFAEEGISGNGKLTDCWLS